MSRLGASSSALDFLGGAPLSRALTLVILGTGFAAEAIRAMIGLPGYTAMILGLVALAGLSLATRARVIDWNGVLPISILVFVAWAALSVFWSTLPFVSLVRVGYLVALAFLGVYIAITRDTIQIVRSVGDVMRILLGVSIGLEILSGVLIDTPIAFLGIEGNLAALGPIQGVFGSRNLLGFMSLIALITFLVEWRTRSVRRGTAVGSLVLGALCLLLTGSPTSLVAAAVVAVATAALYGIRRAAPSARRSIQFSLLGGVALVAVLAFAMRGRILAFLDARAEFEVRLDLWRLMFQYQRTDQGLLGWGWVGPWPRNAPYYWIGLAADRQHGSGLSAWMDVLYQLGVVGLCIFVAMVGLAFVRAWLLASERRSEVYVWPALVLVAIVLTSFAESFALTDGGWMLLIVCAVKAARDMSWRDALSRKPAPAGPSLPRLR
ncbi:O-antigen ligase family protein [Agromyces seonyuensis]|uniref:O-antigen ligase-related domain-containing protein n=1 Tax=Agromyces seonyuensis TaxID=2662446 RepID=A0A6I4P5L6_9MICO|nr:O-antigen ligase family protein [Agromyces seonyuensis]MWB98847.1 hypothetical protein [Agromyces seonyuensis]